MLWPNDASFALERHFPIGNYNWKEREEEIDANMLLMVTERPVSILFCSVLF